MKNYLQTQQACSRVRSSSGGKVVKVVFVISRYNITNLVLTQEIATAKLYLEYFLHRCIEAVVRELFLEYKIFK